ncbi:MAG: hypothetical protein LBI39_03885 [Puniceicoccales bacterium]|jgi:hypothetical protein|nr:hypothetical protein [Puniceicoccales bacterium]
MKIRQKDAIIKEVADGNSCTMAANGISHQGVVLHHDGAAVRVQLHSNVTEILAT